MPRYGHRSEPHTQVAASRMTASVGFSILGSSRSSTRTSPGAYSTAPRMAVPLRVGGSVWVGQWTGCPTATRPVAADLEPDIYRPEPAQRQALAGPSAARRPEGTEWRGSGQNHVHPAPTRPAPNSYVPVESRESDSSAGPAPGDGRREHDEDRRDDDTDDPPGPVDALGRLDPQGSGDVVADEHAADATEDSQPERDVVPVAGSDELAEQPDDEACDENSDDVHDGAFRSRSVADRACSTPERPRL